MVSWGLVFGRVCVHQRTGQLFHPAISVGLAEVGFLPRYDPLFHLLVPTLASCPHRRRLSMAAIPVSIGLGAPISTALLELDGVLAVAGWRWLFLCEAAPAVIFGIATFLYLTDRPAQANWLEAEEREWLATEMEKERQTVATGRAISVLQSLFNPRVLALAAIHFGQAGVSVGSQCLPRQIIKQLGLTACRPALPRNPLCARDHRHDRLGHLFRSQERAAVEPDRLLHDDGGGLPDRRAARKQLLGRGGAVARHDRPIPSNAHLFPLRRCS